MDKIFNREQTAKHIGMSSRTVSRLLAGKLIPHIRIFFSKDNPRGLVYFSAKKLDIWLQDDEGLESMSDFEKQAWRVRKKADIAVQLSQERDEELLALEILKLSKTLRACLDDDESLELSAKEREKLRQHEADFESYFEKTSQLQDKEKSRLKEFFEDDEDCLFYYFPGVFEQEIKSRKRTGVSQPKELRGGVPIDRIEQQPGTLKEKKQSIQTVIEEADKVEK